MQAGLPEDGGPVAPHVGLGGQRQADGADLAAGGSESPASATEAGRIWPSDGASVRLRAERPNYIVSAVATPWETRTSTYLSLATISSGVCFFLGMF
jgi:hypothetical protein